MKALGNIGLGIASTVALFVGVIMMRTALCDTHALAIEPAPKLSMRADVAERLAGALRIPTISNQDSRVHGANERISVDDYTSAIRFYRELLLDASRS